MNNYNWDAINWGIAVDAPLWKSYRCDDHNEYDDIVALCTDPLSEGHKASITHGCLTPMTHSAQVIVEAHGLTVGVYVPPPKEFDLEMELIKARCECERSKATGGRGASFPWVGLFVSICIALALTRIITLLWNL